MRIVDRTKDVVKSGGEWISSVELENEIMANPKVAEAAVIGVKHPKWSERPLACVVVRPGEELTARGAARVPRAAGWRSGGCPTTSCSSTRCPRPPSASSPRRTSASASPTTSSPPPDPPTAQPGSVRAQPGSVRRPGSCGASWVWGGDSVGGSGLRSLNGVYRFLLRPLLDPVAPVRAGLRRGLRQPGPLAAAPPRRAQGLQRRGQGGRGHSRPEPVSALLPAGPDSTAADVDAVQYRSVVVTGTYRTEQQVLVQNHTNGGAPGYWVLTPLVQADGTAVVINRGWVPFSYTEDGPWTDFDPPSGTVSVSGMVQKPQVRCDRSGAGSEGRRPGRAARPGPCRRRPPAAAGRRTPPADLRRPERASSRPRPGRSPSRSPRPSCPRARTSTTPASGSSSPS